MASANGLRGGLLTLLACVTAVALVGHWRAKPPVPAEKPSPSVAVLTSPTPQDTGMLAVQVARLYKPGDPKERFRLGARKLDLRDNGVDQLLLLDLDDPSLAPDDPVKNKEALRRILTQPPTDPQWPENAVRMSVQGDGESSIVSLSDPVSDPKRPGRYYFLAGRGERYYDGLGLLTVDVPADRSPLKLDYDIFMSVEAPTVPPNPR